MYKDFVSNTPHFEPGKPSFGVLMCMVVYLVELCRRFLDNDRGHEIPSIHAHATRLMLDPETLLAPANWVSLQRFGRDVLNLNSNFYIFI